MLVEALFVAEGAVGAVAAEDAALHRILEAHVYPVVEPAPRHLRARSTEAMYDPRAALNEFWRVLIDFLAFWFVSDGA